MPQYIDIDEVIDDARKTFKSHLRSLENINNEKSWNEFYLSLKSDIKQEFGCNSEELSELENINMQIDSVLNLDKEKSEIENLIKKIIKKVRRYDYWENKRLTNLEKNFANTITNNNGNMIINTNSPHSNIEISQNQTPFEEIAKIIDNSNIQNKKEVLDALNELKLSLGNKNDFLKKYNNFIVSLANHSEILSCIQSFLTQIF